MRHESTSKNQRIIDIFSSHDKVMYVLFVLRFIASFAFMVSSFATCVSIFGNYDNIRSLVV